MTFKRNEISESHPNSQYINKKGKCNMSDESMALPMHGMNAPGEMTQDDPARGNLDKIRDILFGAQTRDTDARFGALEKRLTEEAGELRNELTKRFDALEHYMRREVSALNERLHVEQRERNAVATGLAESQHSAVQAFNEKVGQLFNHVSDRHHEMQQQLHDSSNTLGNQFRQAHEEMSAVFERALQELRASKTDRASLAILLAEMAHKLNHDN
ncbi:MAG: hypothetical protein NVSMB56_04390 [Pyrinomonadaceae bacterium]